MPQYDLRYDNEALQEFAYGNGDINAQTLLSFVRPALQRLQSDEYENSQFIAGLADILQNLDRGRGLIAGMDSRYRQAQDSATARSTFLDRFPEAQSIQIGMAVSAMRTC